ncbi:MAG: glycerol-3-phosphate 1-O-acyltransferase PlsY [Mariprofundaceae bacterium]|nr:glycerol-3-phosphate 1-O-acyltransferase PlsY [Mariprofundaceae bacterium]
MSIEALLLLAAAYLLGAIPFGLLLTRWLTGKDPREFGSGNIGATNASRTGGKKIGLLTLVADIIKGTIPVAIAVHFDSSGSGNEWLVAGTAIAAFLGHIYPVYLGFKGGKGVATMFGVLIPWEPVTGLIAFAVWLAALGLTRYVAVASILAGLTLPLAAWLHGASLPAILACMLFCTLMSLRHRSNVERLLAGNENRVGGSKKRAA